MSSNFKTPLSVYVLYDKDNTKGSETYEKIYHLLCRNSSRPFEDGLDIPVFFRTDMANQIPPIDINFSNKTIAILLVDDNMYCNTIWDEYIKELLVKEDNGALKIFAVKLSKYAFDINPLLQEEQFICLKNENIETDWHEFQIRLYDNILRYLKSYKVGQKLKLFISHSKKDKDHLGESTAISLRDYLRSDTELLKKLENRFSRIIITTSSIYNIISVLESTTKDVFCGKILPLGHKKRNKLIENYHRLNEENPYSITEQIFLEKTKDSYEQVQTFLGDKLIPSYPIFVLSILQSMNLVKPNNYEQTSYGYCYQSLIHFALAAKAKIKNEDIDTYINYLSELAFSLFDKKKKSLSDIEFQEFHKNYSANYIAPSFIEVRDKLLGSGLLVYDEDEWFHFGYNYIFYFLIAQKIATILTEEKGRQIIQYLCKNIQVDKYANILIFVAHHSKDPFLIDETILASMIPFDDIEPITLERNGSFNELIKDIIQEFKDDIIRSNTDPIQEREKSLESRDKLELQMKDNTYEEDYQNMPSEIISFYQAVRSLEIVGQIIKNRKGSISKQKLHEMIKELYLTAFRTIGFLGKIIKSTKEELTISIQSKVEKDDSKSEIAERINLFFQLMSFNFCLGIFSKVINSVGNRDLKPIFDDVANELNTPAAKLISFSIKTCYGKLSIPELKLLYKEFENNPVALRILKARVKSYLYNNYVKYDERQRIASTLKMSLIQPRGNNLISRT